MKQPFTKKYPYAIPFIILVVIVGGMIFLMAPSITQYITYEGDEGGGDTVNNPWYLTAYGTYVTTWVQETWEEIIYVHDDGDNSTGGYDWEHAYTDLPSAIARAQGTPFWTTLILVGAGTWDVLQPEAQIIDRNIILVGSGRDTTIIRNTHPTARSVFLVQDFFEGHRFTVEFAEVSDGIIVEENTFGMMMDPDIRLHDVRFYTNVTCGGGNVNALSLGTSYGGEFNDVYFDGFCHGIPTAINISNSWDNVFENIKIHDFDRGMVFDINASDNNDFHNIEIYNATTGIQILAGNNQYFRDISFYDVNLDVFDSVGDSLWYNVQDIGLVASIAPNDLTGIVVNGGGGANAYGVNTLIHDDIGSVEPYYITAILYEPSSKERYGIRITIDFGVTYLYETVIEGINADEVNRLEMPILPIINAHSRVWCSVKSETGGDNCDIWVELVKII